MQQVTSNKLTSFKIERQGKELWLAFIDNKPIQFIMKLNNRYCITNHEKGIHLDYFELKVAKRVLKELYLSGIFN
jgi:hypothetical protein